MMKRASSQEKCSSCKPQKTKSSRFGAREFSIRAEDSDISSELARPLPGFNLMDLPLNAPVQAQMAGPVCMECEKEEEERDAEQPAVLQRQANPALDEDEDEDEVLQGKFESSGVEAKPEQAEPRPNRTGMPDRLKAGIESLSRIDMSDVRVHANSPKPARLNALAYTQGNQIYLGPGQERHLPHEAWHAVQQKEGRVRPTMQMKGLDINDNPSLEHEASVMGTKVVQFIPDLEEDQPLRRMSGEEVAQKAEKVEEMMHPHLDEITIKEIAGRWVIRKGTQRFGVDYFETREDAEKALFNIWRKLAKFKFEGDTEADWRSQVLLFMKNFGIDAATRAKFNLKPIEELRPRPSSQYPFSDLDNVVPPELYRYCTKDEADQAERNGIKFIGDIDEGIPTTPIEMSKECAKGTSGIISSDACIKIYTSKIPKIADREDDSLRKTTARTGIEYKILVDIPVGAITRMY